MSGLTIETTDDHTLVDSVVYLSNLASDPKAIDPVLDTLRDITAKWTPPALLGSNERKALQKLIIDLKDYLINRDPLRSFTPESLDARLNNSLKSKQKKLPPYIVIVMGCVAAAALTVFLPLPLAELDRIYISLSVLLLFIALTNAWFYLSSLRNFKPELRIVFTLISACVLIMGLQFVHVTIISLIDSNSNFKFSDLPEIATIGLAIMYLGISRYAKILKIPTKKVTKGLAISLLLTIPACILIAEVRAVDHKLYFIVLLVATIYDVIFDIASSIIAYRLLKNLTVTYARSLRMLYIYLVSGALAGTGFVVALVWLGQLSGGPLSFTVAIYSIPPMLLFLYSGYSFKKETSR